MKNKFSECIYMTDIEKYNYLRKLHQINKIKIAKLRNTLNEIRDEIYKLE